MTQFFSLEFISNLIISFQSTFFCFLNGISMWGFINPVSLKKKQTSLNLSLSHQKHFQNLFAPSPSLSYFPQVNIKNILGLNFSSKSSWRLNIKQFLYYRYSNLICWRKLITCISPKFRSPVVQSVLRLRMNYFVEFSVTSV